MTERLATGEPPATGAGQVMARAHVSGLHPRPVCHHRGANSLLCEGWENSDAEFTHASTPGRHHGHRITFYRRPCGRVRSRGCRGSITDGARRPRSRAHVLLGNGGGTERGTRHRRYRQRLDRQVLECGRPHLAGLGRNQRRRRSRKRAGRRHRRQRQHLCGRCRPVAGHQTQLGRHGRRNLGGAHRRQDRVANRSDPQGRQHLCRRCAQAQDPGLRHQRQPDLSLRRERRLPARCRSRRRCGLRWQRVCRQLHEQQRRQVQRVRGVRRHLGHEGHRRRSVQEPVWGADCQRPGLGPERLCR